MGTDKRPELSKRNKYYISKHRYYELKHKCLQYPEWKRLLALGRGFGGSIGTCTDDVEWSDPTGNAVIFRDRLLKNIEMVESAAVESDPGIANYILKAVTEDLTYTFLRTCLNIPCSKNYYYESYRKFFYILSGKVA